jgi:DNA polymerase-3 subunit delta
VRLSPEQLGGALARGLKSVYLVSGDEPLTVGECADAIRSAARAAGYADRTAFFIERGFSWDELRHSAQALSLFADRRLFELRMPSGKPDKGAQVLLDIAAAPPPDVLILIVTDKLDRKTSEAPWVRAIEKQGAWIPVWPVPAESLPGWLGQRATSLGLRLEPAAARLIVDRVEGNLLAAKQELEILALLADGGAISESLVLRTVGNSARYDVFQLAEAAAAGDAVRALRILAGLRGEGAEPTLILWALVRELRGLWQARSRSAASGAAASGAAAYAQGSWNQAAKPSPRAQRRMAQMPLAALFQEAARADRTIKGILPGDGWASIISLAMGMAGALQAPRDSGRVAS